MKTVYNLVFVKHDGCSKNFLFQAPPNTKMLVGQRLFVDTMYGEKEATAITNNFHVGPDAAMEIIKGCGAYSPLKFVTGFAKKVEKYEKEPIIDDVPF